MKTKKYLNQQYSDDKNLSARMNLHAKYSTNKQGFHAWLWEHYNFFDGCRILELGCGNGAQWEDKSTLIPNKYEFVLSDYSQGMIDIVREKFAGNSGFSFQQIDIMDIPFAENSFDIVIANHMLYHVPDIPKALSEVTRVLKPNGKFYSSTIGSGGMMPYLHNAIKRYDADTTAFSQQFSFTLQNGSEILSEYFSDVCKFEYEDSLSITDTQDLIDWIKSTQTANNIEHLLDDLFVHFEEIRLIEGAINIPKEVGLFVSTNATP